MRYRTVAQVEAHLQQLKTGRIFIPTEMPLPCAMRLRLALMLPDGGVPVSVETEVLESTDRQAAEVERKPAGMLLAVIGQNEAVIELERRLGVPGPPRPSERTAQAADSVPAPADDQPPKPKPPAAASGQDPSGPALSLEWMGAALSQTAAVRESDPEPLPAALSGREKTELTPAERERIKPVGDFVMDLTKAMLRTGYYAPSTPVPRRPSAGCTGPCETVSRREPRSPSRAANPARKRTF